MRQEQLNQTAFVKPSNQTKLEYKIHLQASIDVVRLLLNQGLAFRGHREDASSLNKEDLNGDYFTLLVDESCGVSHKEQITIVLRYVDGGRSIVERFQGIVYVHNTSALCLNEAVVNYLTHLSLSCIRGQCYDGARNMQWHLSGLKALI
ncbi:uncharacterized protein LOC124889652 [Capsicum annuum]|uniref:uncharacterized protein LOC124889652 n=1 Tax=Capsicum annuum TaxID=4072 RepID=UPI001FB0D6AE|nr:uncharacterized protein LOC124889652 [Capsicum annuum]